MCVGRWEPQPAHVWVGGVCNPAGEADVMATLNAAHLPKVSGVLRVGGARPGVLNSRVPCPMGNSCRGSACICLLAGVLADRRAP